MNQLYVKRLSDTAILPTYSTDFAAGLDLYSPIDLFIQPKTRTLLKLDISISLPPQTYGHILPRSGLALNYGIHVGAGVVDEDYRGNVGVLLFNLGEKPLVVKRGDRIAQMVVKPYVHVDVKEVSSLEDTERGDGGFGSSGK